MTPPAYPAARAAAARIHAHFSRNPGPSAAPDTAAIEAILEAAFWASLRREEGYMARFSLAYVAPESVLWPMTFERRLPMLAQYLTRLSPAVERPGIHLGVWQEGGQYFVWGATRNLPPFCAVFEVIEPGLLVVKQSRGDESEKFVNVAVLQGDEIKVINDQSARVPDCPDLLTSLLGLDAPQSSAGSVSVLVRLAVSMRTHGRGGSLLVAPADTDCWRESVVHPIQYALVPPLRELAELAQERNPGRGWAEALQDAVDGVANLTAVDGATVITGRYEVLAFGAKIGRRDGSPRVNEVIVTEPVEGARAEVVEPAQLGRHGTFPRPQFSPPIGTQCCYRTSSLPGWPVHCLRLVALREYLVEAHRIEALLLYDRRPPLTRMPRP